MVFIRFHQISSDFIRTDFFLISTCPWNKTKLKSKSSQKTNTQNQIALQPFGFQGLFVQPFCFFSYGEINEGYEKGDEINPCKVEANLWEQESNPCQREKNICKGEANLCKGEANLCKGETFEKWCSPGRNLEENNLQKLGQLSLQDKIKKTQKTMMMKMKQQRSCSSA